MTKRPTFKDIRDTGSLVKLTSLNEEEFSELLIPFRKACKIYDNEFTFDGEKRKRKPPKKQRANGTFKCKADMLFFIIKYLKLYPIQEAVAYEYKMKQSSVSDWISYLCNILYVALEVGSFLPTRCAEKLKCLLENAENVFQDATERQILRPADNELQRRFYSGKKNSYREESRACI